ncbi:MAG TPA: phosphotransferase, partial [Candidatus Methanoperedens sp.]
PNTKGVQSVWNALIDQYGSEVAVLIDADIKNSEVDARVISAIIAFREGKVKVNPGGGGQYGSVELPGSVAPKPRKMNKKNCDPQTSLCNFDK